MAIAFAVTFTTLLVEDDYLFALDKRSYYFAYNLCTFYCRSTNGYYAIFVCEKHLVEYHFGTLSCFSNVMNIQFAASFGFELLSLNLYDYVHLLFN